MITVIIVIIIIITAIIIFKEVLIEAWHNDQLLWQLIKTLLYYVIYK